MAAVCPKSRVVGIVASWVLAGVVAVCTPLSAADVGITSDTGTRGETPSTTPSSSIYTGFADDTTQPQIVSITTNTGFTLSASGNANLPAGSNGAPLTFFVLFDKDMLTSSESIYTPEGLAWGDVNFTCTDSSVTVDSQTFKYSTGSNRVLELPLTGLLPETGTCQLLLNRGDYTVNGEGSTGTIRDASHNPTPIALYPISSTCTVNDSFVNNSIGCWSQQNSTNGSFSMSGGVLNYSSTAGSVTGSSAPALRKTGVSLKAGQTDLSVALTVNSVSLQTGDGIGLRFTDPYGDYVMLLVYNDGSNNRYDMIFSNGTTTSTAYLFNNYDATSNNTMTLHITDNGSLAYPYGRNTLNNLTTEPDGLVWAGPGGKFGSSNVTVDIVGIRGAAGGTASAVLDSFTVVDGVQ